MTELTIALDAMGGDQGPGIVVTALERALSSFTHVHFILVGDEAVLTPLLQRYPKVVASSRVSMQHASQVVAMDDKPSAVLRAKPDSSMRGVLELVHNGTAQGCVSAGNTGALMAMSYLTLKTLPGVLRPALVASLPQQDGGQSLLLDLGANPTCDAETLCQFAVMGSVMAQQVNKQAQPRVALLNMGREDLKGHDVVKHAAQLLKASTHVNYIGFVEGNDLFSSTADVIVCDGFTGNIALKSCEGLAELLYDNLRKSFSGHFFTKLVAKLLFRRHRKSWQWLNPDQYNGASLLGLRGVVMKSHGNASANAYFSAISHAIDEAAADLPSLIHDRIEDALLERVTDQRD
ncbi:phosphate acyltransferase PlsX [Aliidiomarina soli]|uniref:Phosphate acyltransferase n=1 Tax=Aliidiomarina soli TaxID=1928574 RepID=A0A432WMJ4_9GAMM|nr:phosphate acyltransferase PlsX [Aliidiomarina soli]RUO35013.1 phosphate acyltransferase [Aliidiomarina soli]